MSQRPLSAREKQIALLVADGFTNDEIGSRLNISPRTVKSATDSIKWKFGIQYRRQIAAEMRRRGLL